MISKGPMVDVAANHRRVMERISQAAARTGRDASSVKLLAAAKSQDAELVRAAIVAGVSLIGENYVQEAQAKKARISEAAEWHMIGHLQRNKAKSAVALFDLIETLDSIALALELDKEGRKTKKRIRTFVEVNLAGEESKTGIAKDQVFTLLQEAAKLPNIIVEGLMTVPPFREDPEQTRPYFRELRELLGRMRELQLPNLELKELSMGMSHDYPVAIEEGATIVRIGTALFGPRKA
ncbi:MAG: YggS family pyridoxal phosphate-dependent enzyme [Alphaproteobacteria bacterium]